MQIIVKGSRNCETIILGTRGEETIIKALRAFTSSKFSMGTKEERDYAQYLLNDVFNLPTITPEVPTRHNMNTFQPNIDHMR